MEYFEKIVDAATGQETIRPYTAEEIAESEKNAAETAKRQADENAVLSAHAAARAALLDKLGITADEAKLLLG